MINHTFWKSPSIFALLEKYRSQVQLYILQDFYFKEVRLIFFKKSHKAGSSSKAEKKKKKSSKRARTSARSRKQTSKYAENSSESEASSSTDSQSDASYECKKPNGNSAGNSKSKHRVKKKARRASSHNSDNSEVSPLRRGKKKPQNSTFDDDEAPESDFDPFSNENSRQNSSAACSSRLSSRGRLLKTVPQY